VRATIDGGRNGTMPAHLPRLGETRVKLLAAYVLSLSATHGEQDEDEEHERRGAGAGHDDAR